jgi:hypothetical protein
VERDHLTVKLDTLAFRADPVAPESHTPPGPNALSTRVLARALAGRVVKRLRLRGLVRVLRRIGG